MPDERQDSIAKGMHAPKESTVGQDAAEENRRRAADGPEIGGGLGGTSDADSPADEAMYEAQRTEAQRREVERQRRERAGTEPKSGPDVGPGEGAD